MDGQVAIVGIGEVPSGRYPERTSLEAALTCARQAIEDAGLSVRDIDAVLVAPAFADAAYNLDAALGRLVEDLGMRDRARVVMSVNSGGSTGERMVRIARGLIATGQARFVLCTHADKFTELTREQVLRFFAIAGFDKQFELPYGLTYNSIGSLAAVRYMYETGATEEHIASVAVSMRAWAALNPNAKHFGAPLTLAEVLATPVIQWPIRSAMAPPPADGGSSFVVAGAKDAGRLRDRAAYLIADASRMRTFSFTQHDDLTRMGWADVGSEAYAEAGLAPTDIGIAEIYMSYPPLHLILLEELGFCRRGEAGPFVAAGNTLPGGALPMATNGEAIGSGHTGSGVGVANVVETARQLMGAAGDRQVKDVEFVLETACGGSYMDANVSIWSVRPR
jgi:acetyl-CoA C-acetyltransferase